MIPVKAVLEADLAVVGGGIGGLMAAISAAQAGAEKVIILEKAHVRRSGSGATGNDHFRCFLPEYHKTLDSILQQTLNSPIGMTRDPVILRQSLEKSFDLVRMWEEWGINMRPTGKYEFMGHAFPGRLRPSLKYDGRNQKAVLTAQAKKRGVRIFNHHPALDLCVAEEDGARRVTGVLALDMSVPEPAFVLVRAKTVLLATGLTHRMYLTGPTPAYMFNTSHCPNCAGGQALAWRAGARLVNMEIPYVHAGPKYFARAGKATWIGVYRYPDGRPVGPFVTRPDVVYGDITGDVWNSAFTDVMLDGSGPVYQDCSGASAEELAFMRKAMFSEGLSAMVHYMDEHELDPGRHAFEFMQYEPTFHGRGVEVKPDAETSVAGLFAAGDMVGNGGAGISPAAYLGWTGGEHAAKKAAGLCFTNIEDNPALKRRMELFSSFLKREEGPDWKEANFALQQIMSDYAPAGPHRVRSATLLRAGMEYLEQLRAEALSQIRAGCSHTLMRTGEVLDLLDCGRAVLHAALAREESRAGHRRSDFRFTNPLLNSRQLNVWLEDGEVKTGFRDKWM